MPNFLKGRSFWMGVVVSLCALMVLATYAKAADKGAAPVTRAEAAQLAPANPWTGCYGGVGIGVVALASDFGGGADGYAVGGNVGCDLQINQIVIGAWTSYDWKRFSITGSSMDLQQWDVGGRLGVALNQSTLLYGLVGRAQLRAEGDTANGLVIGGGIQTFLRRDVSVSLEYKRTTLDDSSDTREHSVMTHLSYHFNAPWSR